MNPYLITLGGLLFTVLCQVLYLSYRVGQASIKIDTLWDFIIRRAKVEFVEKGFGVMQSPLAIKAGALKLIEPFVMRVLPFYNDLVDKNPAISDKDLFIELEMKFGDDLVKQVCIPHNLTAGACMILVIEGCRGTGNP